MARPSSTNSFIIKALEDILLSNQTSTQEEIKQALLAKGFSVNQTKISRLLRKVGAIKTLNPKQQLTYSLPHEPAPITSTFILSTLIRNISANEVLIIIQTNPGSASLVARLLDHHQPELNILGTIAGDDTLFVAPRSIKEIKKVQLALSTFLANQHS